MASGLMSSSRDGVPPPPAPIQFGSPNPPLRFTRTPSTYTTGSFACVRLAEPRIRIWAPSPARPPLGSTDTAGSRPANRARALGHGARRAHADGDGGARGERRTYRTKRRGHLHLL